MPKASASEADGVGEAVRVADGPQIERVEGRAVFIVTRAAVGVGVVGTAGLRALAASGMAVLGHHAGEVVAVAREHVHVKIPALRYFFAEHNRVAGMDDFTF